MKCKICNSTLRASGKNKFTCDHCGINWIRDIEKKKPEEVKA